MMTGSVEGQRFYFMILGHRDPDKLLSSHEALKEAIIAHTDRTDLRLGDVVYVTDYRYAFVRIAPIVCSYTVS